jgi:hypothetical protein
MPLNSFSHRIEWGCGIEDVILLQHYCPIRVSKESAILTNYVRPAVLTKAQFISDVTQHPAIAPAHQDAYYLIATADGNRVDKHQTAVDDADYHV